MNSNQLKIYLKEFYKRYGKSSITEIEMLYALGKVSFDNYLTTCCVDYCASYSLLACDSVDSVSAEKLTQQVLFQDS